MKWIRFDIVAFLKDSPNWDDEIAKRQDELDSMPELPAINNPSGVRSGNTSNPAMRMALKRLEIEAEIDELRLNKEMLNYAFKSLTEDEKTLIHGFFFSRKRKSTFVYSYGRQHGLCRDYVYNERDRVLRKMQATLEREYYGEA